MAWHRPGNKPLSEPMMVRLLAHSYASLGLDESYMWHHFLARWTPSQHLIYFYWGVVMACCLTAPIHYLNRSSTRAIYTVLWRSIHLVILQKTFKVSFTRIHVSHFCNRSHVCQGHLILNGLAINQNNVSKIWWPFRGSYQLENHFRVTCKKHSLEPTQLRRYIINRLHRYKFCNLLLCFQQDKQPADISRCMN